jgi:hypothetical protein
MYISCESAVRSVLRPFAPITRPFSWILARFLGAVNTVSAAWQYTLTHVIRPPVNAVRTSAILTFFGSASRGPSIVASQVPDLCHYLVIVTQQDGPVSPWLSVFWCSCHRCGGWCQLLLPKHVQVCCNNNPAQHDFFIFNCIAFARIICLSRSVLS